MENIVRLSLAWFVLGCDQFARSIILAGTGGAGVL